MSGKKLYKSRDQKVGGVCGGVAEYFDIDPTIVRLVWGIAALTTGIGIAAYIVAAIVMNDAPAEDVVDTTYRETEPEVDAEPVSDTIKGFDPEA